MARENTGSQHRTIGAAEQRRQYDNIVMTKPSNLEVPRQRWCFSSEDSFHLYLPIQHPAEGTWCDRKIKLRDHGTCML